MLFRREVLDGTKKVSQVTLVDKHGSARSGARILFPTQTFRCYFRLPEERTSDQYADVDRVFYQARPGNSGESTYQFPGMTKLRGCTRCPGPNSSAGGFFSAGGTRKSRVSREPCRPDRPSRQVTEVRKKTNCRPLR